jgi:hypothetical protein
LVVQQEEPASLLSEANDKMKRFATKPLQGHHVDDNRCLASSLSEASGKLKKHVAKPLQAARPATGA